MGILGAGGFGAWVIVGLGGCGNGVEAGVFGKGTFSPWGFGATGEGTGICDNGVNDGRGETRGVGAAAFSVSGVISVIVLIGSGTGGFITGGV